MADNYLEKKFEEYAAKKAGKPVPRRVAPTSNRPGVVNVKFPRRRVLVTGGASGIGRAIVKQLCEAGCQVAFCDINANAGQATAEALGAQFHHTDVRDARQLEQCMEHIFHKWGDIDIIINNVGVSEFTPIEECSIEQFDSVIATNLRPVFITSRKLALWRRSLPLPRHYGRIINICSTRWQQSEPASEAYAASKGGILSLTHALAMSLADLHITVNSISPGWIATDNYDRLTDADHRQHPSGRVGKPDDIARTCLFICLENNDFLNGENITIDGGMTKKMIYI